MDLEQAWEELIKAMEDKLLYLKPELYKDESDELQERIDNLKSADKDQNDKWKSSYDYCTI